MNLNINNFYKTAFRPFISPLSLCLILMLQSLQGKAQSSGPWEITGPTTVINGTTTTFSVPQSVNGMGSPSAYAWSLVTGGHSSIIGYNSTVQITWNGSYNGGVALKCWGSFVSGGLTTQKTITVLATVQPVVAGTISPLSQIVSYGDTAYLAGTTPTQGMGNYNYQWQKASVKEYAQGRMFINIPGATSQNYLTLKLTDTTYYRRIDADPAVSGSTFTNDVIVKVYKPLLAGSVSPASQSVGVGGALSTLSCAPATGGSGVYTYQWQRSFDLVLWENVLNATSTSLNPTLINGASYYRLAVVNNNQTRYSNISGVFDYACCWLNYNKNYISASTFRQAGVTSTNINPKQIPAAGGNQTVQYFDGLGRPVQTIQVRASPSARDIVIPIEYDQYGREAVKYLPYASTNDYGGFEFSAVADQAAFYHPVGSISGTQQTNGIVNTSTPYSVTNFETSPLNRIKEEGAPGDVWQPAVGGRTSIAGRTSVREYKNNNSSIDYTRNGFAVRLYTAVPITVAGKEYERMLSNITGKLYYNANQLQVTISKDENWIESDGKAGTVEEFKDKEGRVLLKRFFNKRGTTIETLSTYYVYDDLGNLSFTLPPGANPDTESVPIQVTLDNFCYQYRYDGRKRLIEKKIPGKGWEYMVYNQLDQLVASQDVSQRSKANQDWLINKYDALGRVVLMGIYNYPLGTANINYRAIIQNEVNVQSSQWEDRIGTGIGYTTNKSFPTAALTTTLSVNYYDDYNIPGLPLESPYNLGDGTTYSKMTKTLPTANRVNVLGTSQMLWTVNYYDNEARVVRSIQQHYKGSAVSNSNYNDINNTYSFVGEVLTSTRRHYVNGTEQLYEVNRFIFDHQGRPKDIFQKTGDNVSTNNPEVMLIRKNYNEIGQLTNKQLYSTNSGASFAQTIAYAYNPRGWLKSQSSPLFTQNLKYEDGAVSQYNGNISRQEWGTGKYYNYLYNKLNRLSSAMSNENHNEVIDYDVMGNITRLQRKQAGILVDQLKYNYTSSNQLGNVVDSTVTNTSAAFQLPGTTSYVYDQNGNISSKINPAYSTNNLTSITYNYLNLPSTMTAGAAAVNYTYDASGNKLSKQVASIGLNNEYIRGIQYEGNVLKYVSTPEGRVVRNSETSYSYEYTLADHLGNGRVYFDINGGVARKIQETDYYAFGLDIQRSLIGTENKYQYNGKEKQDEVKLYDYGARFYDPVIGRFNTIDPLADQRVWVSPYNYVQNNPISRNDPTGALDDWVTDEDNNPHWDPNVTSATDKDLKKGDTYIGKSAEYTATNGYGVELNSDGTWNYQIRQPSNDLPYLQSVDAFKDAISGNMPALNLASTIAETTAMLAGTPAAEVSVGASGFAKWASGLVNSSSEGRVFWSGGAEAMNAAANYASSIGGKTLEMTTGGKVMTALNPVLSRSISNPIWNKLSTSFARGASGSVDVFQNVKGVRLESIWAKTEYGILSQNNVNIIYHTVFP